MIFLRFYSSAHFLKGQDCPEMEALANHVRSLAKSSDDETRIETLNQLRSLIASIETPDDTIHRFNYAAMQLAGIRIGLDLDLFTLLVDSESPLTLIQESQKTNADPNLLGR